ncbi:MAG: hypothetical protein N2688_06070 [Burkholderiaceae bacterium]|nr:hypothetical protein [Burkholderiaceae bacterium]
MPDFHGWEHATWDGANRKLYRRPYHTRALRRWDGGATWTTIDLSSQFQYDASLNAIEWFPERNEILIVQQENGPYGKVVGYNPNRDAFTTLSSTLGNAVNDAWFAHYSPHHKVVWIGAGTANWVVSASGAVMSRASSPYRLGPTYGAGLMVCNPSNGNFITMLNANTWHDFDPVANVWTPRPGLAQVLAAPIHTSDWPAFGVVAVPVFEYGVIAFIKAYSGAGGVQMWLYKP